MIYFEDLQVDFLENHKLVLWPLNWVYRIFRHYEHIMAINKFSVVHRRVLMSILPQISIWFSDRPHISHWSMAIDQGQGTNMQFENKNSPSIIHRKIHGYISFPGVWKTFIPNSKINGQILYFRKNQTYIVGCFGSRFSLNRL